jgi:hypothetical protein
MFDERIENVLTGSVQTQSSGLRRGIVTGSFTERSLLWGAVALVDASGVVCEWKTPILRGGVSHENAQR